MAWTCQPHGAVADAVDGHVAADDQGSATRRRCFGSGHRVFSVGCAFRSMALRGCRNDEFGGEMSRVDANDGGYLTGNTFSEYGCDGVRQVNAPSEAPKPADLPASLD